MSLTSGVGSGNLFVYSPLTNAGNIKSNNSASVSTSENQIQKNNENIVASEQTQKTENNPPKGYKNQPNESVTGEKLLSSMPLKKEGEKEGKTVDNLSKEEKEQVDELKKRDTEVKTHEQAHMAAAGTYAKGSPGYTYETGPDGNRYAVGGEVQIDSSPVEGDPQATIAKAQIIAASAMAPAEPSGQDRAVAAQARKMMAQAQAELVQKNTDKTEEADTETNNTVSNNEQQDQNISQKTEKEGNSFQQSGKEALSFSLTHSIDLTA